MKIFYTYPTYFETIQKKTKNDYFSRRVFAHEKFEEFTIPEQDDPYIYVVPSGSDRLTDCNFFGYNQAIYFLVCLMDSNPEINLKSKREVEALLNYANNSGSASDARTNIVKALSRQKSKLRRPPLGENTKGYKLEVFHDEETVIVLAAKQNRTETGKEDAHGIFLVTHQEWRNRLAEKLGVPQSAWDLLAGQEGSDSSTQAAMDSASAKEESLITNTVQSKEEEVSTNKEDKENSKTSLPQETFTQFPEITEGAVQRTQLQKLLDDFKDRQGKALGIFGDSGTGKTQLAVSFLLKQCKQPNSREIDTNRAVFLDCAQVGFDDQFIKCLQHLAAPEDPIDLEAVRGEIDKEYNILSPSQEESDEDEEDEESDEDEEINLDEEDNGQGEELNTFARWFHSSHEPRFILLDNCGHLLTRKGHSSFIKALRSFIKDKGSCLTLILTFKQKEAQTKIQKDIHGIKITELEELDTREIDQYLENKVTNERREEFKKQWKFLNGHGCATPLIITQLLDLGSLLKAPEVQELAAQLKETIRPFLNEHGKICEEDAKEEEANQEKIWKARKQVLKLIVERRLAPLHKDDTNAIKVLASLSILSSNKAGNQVARFPLPMIKDVYKKAFRGDSQEFVPALDSILNLNICSGKKDFCSFRHELLQELVQEWFPNQTDKAFHHAVAGDLLEKQMLKPSERSHVTKWALSGAYQYLESGNYQRAATIIDSMDSNMRTSFLYEDCYKVRKELESSLDAERAQNPKTTQALKDIQFKNYVDLAEICYQGLDEWGWAKEFIHLAEAKKPLQGSAPEWAVQGRNLRKILVYEKEIPEKIVADAMQELIDLSGVDRSVMANVFNTDGMYRTRDENYDAAIKSYSVAAKEILEHKLELDEVILGLAKAIPKNLQQSLGGYLTEWVSLDILRYYSNLASAQSLQHGPELALRDLDRNLDSAKKKAGLPLDKTKKDQSKQDFHYYNLNLACFYLAAGDYEEADERLTESGELPNEEWFRLTTRMLQAVVDGYTRTNDKIDVPRKETPEFIKNLQALEKDFTGLDSRNCAFARFNNIAQHINCLLSLEDSTNLQSVSPQEWHEIFCELVNVLRRPYWFSESDFKDAEVDKSAQAPEDNKNEILALCRSSKLGGLADFIEQFVAEERAAHEKETEWELENGHLIEAINTYINVNTDSRRTPLRDVVEKGNHLEWIVKNMKFEESSTPTNFPSLQDDIDRHCCFERLRFVLRPVLREKVDKDLIHEYPFAAKVINYTSWRLGEELKKLQDAGQIGINIPNEIVLKIADDEKEVVERYYGGLMESGKTGAKWRAPLLMPRIVLLRSKPITPSKDSFEKTCHWLKEIETAKKVEREKAASKVKKKAVKK